MRPRNVPAKKLSAVARLMAEDARKTQEGMFYNLEGRGWLQRQVSLIGKGRFLLRKSSVRTPIVKQKAAQLSIGKNATSSAISIVNWCVNNIKFKETANMTAVKFYCKQTANDIVAGRPIPTFRGSKFGIVGCQTFAGTLIGLLRAAKPKVGKITAVRAVRTVSPKIGVGGVLIGMPHTIVTFKINGEPYVADAFKKGYSFFGTRFIGLKGKVMVPERIIASQVAELKKQGLWKEALDPADHGVNTFEAYIREARESGREIARSFDLEKFLENIEK